MSGVIVDANDQTGLAENINQIILEGNKTKNLKWLAILIGRVSNIKKADKTKKDETIFKII